MNYQVMLALTAAALGTACASYDAYIPEEKATATLSGRTAARYPMPQGDVRVASFGISELRRQDSDDKDKAVHVRLAVANTGRTPVTIDVRKQRVQFPDGQQVGPALARAPAGDVPAVNVPPASSRVVDMLFPIPASEPDQQPPTFDVVWNVERGGGDFTQLTPFDQVEVDPAIAQQEAAEDLFYGPTWYNPVWGPRYPGGWWWY